MLRLKITNSTQGTVVKRYLRKRAADLNDTDYEGLGYDMALEMHKDYWILLITMNGISGLSILLNNRRERHVYCVHHHH